MSLKISLQAKAGNWEKFKIRKANEKFRKIAQIIMNRDKFTCQFTGYRGPGVEIINKDGNYQNNTKENLVTADAMAARCFLLDAYPLDYSGADKIIYLPELSQGQLINLCRTLFIQMTGEGQEKAAYNARMVVAQLQDRANWLDDKTGCKLSNPGLFSHYLARKDKNIELIQKLRWLPAYENYQDAVPGWRQAMQAMLVE